MAYPAYNKTKIQKKKMNNSECKCALKITHIGEELFAKALTLDDDLLKIVTEDENITFTVLAEANFTFEDVLFDGEHKIDVLLVPTSNTNTGKAIPVELKLGKSRMQATRSGFGRFLTGYKIENKDNTKKVKGSMVSILSQKKANENEISIAPLKFGDKELCAEWRLIVLTEAIAEPLRDKNFWNNLQPPKVFSFEELFKNKKDLLNKLVEELTKSESYYDEWLK